MNLFLDTSQSKCNIAVFENEKIISSISVPTKNNMTDIVVEEIDYFLTQNKINKNEIKGFFLTNGPGSFTGIRVATLIAKSWKLIKNVDLYYVDSLRLQVPYGTPGVSLLDAKGDKVFYAKYNSRNKKIWRARLLSKEKAKELIKNKNVFEDYKNSDIFQNLILNLRSFKKCGVINKLKCFYLKGAVNANSKSKRLFSYKRDSTVRI